MEAAFRQADLGVSKITDEIVRLDGFSGMKTRHFYNNLLDRDDARYLEVGTWKGSSACSAMYKNKANVVLIDNWSEFNGPRDECLSNIVRFKGDNTVVFIEKDSWSVDVSKIPKRNIYMYDGDHDEQSHYRALTHFYECLDDVFTFVVDDWNWDRVRKGTFDAIRDLELNIIEEHEIRLSQDGSYTEQKDGWWNGIYACVLSKNKDRNV
jgi:hypothetical protein